MGIVWMLKMEDGRWRMEDGEWRMEDGGWRMENGEWRIEDGEWRMENGEMKVAESYNKKGQEGYGPHQIAPNFTKTSELEVPQCRLPAITLQTIKNYFDRFQGNTTTSVLHFLQFC